jgi:MtfA peptidase
MKSKRRLVLGFRERRRKRLLAEPFPEDWSQLVENRVPYYRLLTPGEKELLKGLIHIFLDEKPFEGCGGMAISKEVEVTIAGHACILLLGGASAMYPKLRTILVYPHAYVAPSIRPGPGGIVSEGLEERSGESWSLGNVVLSWDDILQDIAGVDRGRNVVFHEFAHQLDFESGASKNLKTEYNGLVRSIERGDQGIIDSYGAVSPAEFFAVVTECFFLRPAELKVRHSELYEQFRLFYGQDPVLRFEGR